MRVLYYQRGPIQSRMRNPWLTADLCLSENLPRVHAGIWGCHYACDYRSRCRKWKRTPMPSNAVPREPWGCPSPPQKASATARCCHAVTIPAHLGMGLSGNSKGKKQPLLPTVGASHQKQLLLLRQRELCPPLSTTRLLLDSEITLNP